MTPDDKYWYGETPNGCWTICDSVTLHDCTHAYHQIMSIREAYQLNKIITQHHKTQ